MPPSARNIFPSGCLTSSLFYFSSPTRAVCCVHLPSFFVLLWSRDLVMWAYITAKICNCENSAYLSCGSTDIAFLYSRPDVNCRLYICSFVVKHFGLPFFLLWKVSSTAITSILMLTDRQLPCHIFGRFLNPLKRVFGYGHQISRGPVRTHSCIFDRHNRRHVI
jgi:hypothetical protein